MRVDSDLNYDWFWFVTWTTYGSFVPGDQRGATGLLHDQDRSIREHNQLGQDHTSLSSSHWKIGQGNECVAVKFGSTWSKQESF